MQIHHALNFFGSFVVGCEKTGRRGERTIMEERDCRFPFYAYINGFNLNLQVTNHTAGGATA